MFVNEIKNNLKLKVKMLTGDQKSRAVAVGEKIGIAPEFIFSEQTLDSKQPEPIIVTVDANGLYYLNIVSNGKVTTKKVLIP